MWLCLAALLHIDVPVWGDILFSLGALELSAYGGFMYADGFGYLGLQMTYFQQGRYLVSLCVGKLCVCFHECSFDLVVGEALILPQLTSPTRAKWHLLIEFKESY